MHLLGTIFSGGLIPTMRKKTCQKIDSPSVLVLMLISPAPSKLLRFEQYTSTRLLAQFDEDLQQVQKISLRISTGNVIGPRYKMRLLRIRLTPLDRPERSVLEPHASQPRTECSIQGFLVVWSQSCFPKHVVALWDNKNINKKVFIW